ncbi:flagellar biosynthesis anti-sigma factor FlgM [Sporosarcina sp. P12(2017)]|uniref:flagellar biosynthesis anti-sigma factor FlgM n=1 Tax=unclassified Sporosarcina TaxID=2647733 RepID=UPI000C171F29|nr:MULTISPECIES: flagellar biosynthesis anti-sigma factor FlgM [unclassified Sporosarcina]PIC56253.1 flagellar biosynthesis anti-sigma factor FlgM [Sporosarcina sp. P10]PIC59497.1 flagellar biosynthesis anti-sigma factor FlgM [Sporosarcina sp. P12(2017)]
MKIDGFKTQAVNPYRNQQMKVDQAKQAAQVKTDKLEISSEAKKLSAASPIESARQTRVQELKAQVQSGEYQVDASKLASSMLSYFNKP